MNNQSGSRKRCLYVYPTTAPFIDNDAKVLRRRYEVVEYRVKLSKNPFKLALALLRYGAFLCRELPRADLVFAWFADYHSLLDAWLARLWRKPVFRVVGGYEVEYIPRLGYGGLKNPLRAFCVTQALQTAARLLCVSRHTLHKTLPLITHARWEVLYNGVDPADFRQREGLPFERRSGFLTVGNFDCEQYMLRKGIDRLGELARALPHETFTIVGVRPWLNSPTMDSLPSNVAKRDYVPLAELQGYYESARWYLQLSESESFGVAVLEALSFGCVTVISNKAALPEIFAEASVVLDTDKLVDNMDEVISVLSSARSDTAAAAQLLDRYDIARRYARLEEILP
ncbi:MAG: glycosyltransferase [Candidatus Cloacimonetes bacterium]|nr:glycosyltransferase [Candidatus Cloacimonadota bacterium]